jgi:hypothetical protein
VIVRLEVKESQDSEDMKEICTSQCKLEGENEATTNLKAFYNKVKNYWSDINLGCNIGHIQYAAAITVDIEGSTLYTSDWAVFLAIEVKVRDKFEGNVIDLSAF